MGGRTTTLGQFFQFVLCISQRRVRGFKPGTRTDGGRQGQKHGDGGGGTDADTRPNLFFFDGFLFLR